MPKKEKSTLAKMFKPPKKISKGLPDFLKELVYMTIAVIIFFWFGSSFHVLMNGYRTYKSTDFKGVDVNSVPYTCDKPPPEGENYTSLNYSDSLYCANGLETLWGVFPEIIEWYQNTLKDVFSTSRTTLMKIIRQVRGNYVNDEPAEGMKGFLFLMFSGLASMVSVFGAGVAVALYVIFYSFMNMKHLFFVNNPYIVLKSQDGSDAVGEAEFSTWIANGNDSYLTFAFGYKCLKFLFYNLAFWAVGLAVLLVSCPTYLQGAMLYWITLFPSFGDKSFKKEGKYDTIWKILLKHGKYIATLWIILAGWLANRNLGFGAAISAILVLILHLGLNFFGYTNKEKVNI